MINGFLHAEGRKIVDGDGREVLLKGWGLGNWLLQEGYMWLAGGERFDRPTRIEQTLAELTGSDYAEDFWRRYRAEYVRREDIMRMARLGYNSVRIPFHYKLFMTDSDRIQWKEEGFRLLDECLAWCEEAGIYAFLDLHAAPGGQTGSNIDDSANNVPELFLEEKHQRKCVALWGKLAQRYCDRAVIGGYDLLNEPIAPAHAGGGNFDYLMPELAALYQELVRVIRQADQNHLLSLEGAHWATDLSVFDRCYDRNMVLHFHRYAVIPDAACLQKYIQKANEWNIPLWLGETGENMDEWYAALYPLSLSMGIGYNLWTWKKMECTNSPYSIRKPGEYEKLLGYFAGGEHPGEKKAQKILNEYLDNIKIENCVENSAVHHHVFRTVPFSMRATDFDQIPGSGISFSGNGKEADYPYRKGCGMKLVELGSPGEKRFCFDCQWDRFGLVLGKGEFACYQVNTEDYEVEISLADGYQGGELGICGNGEEQYVKISPEVRRVSATVKAGNGRLRLRMTDGEVCLERLSFQELKGHN